MEHRRFKYLVSVERDYVPGWGHQPEDARNMLQVDLDFRISHYHPTVDIVPDTVVLLDVEQIVDRPQSLFRLIELFNRPELVRILTILYENNDDPDYDIESAIGAFYSEQEQQ